jgi:hypothetical protein
MNPLKTGSLLLAVSAVGLFFATLGILTPAPDLDTKIGRHLAAGGLANAALAFTLLLVATNAIRRGERWGLAPFIAALVLYGLPILMVDATHVARPRLLRTLAPQIAGMALMVTGIAVVSFALFSRNRR